MDKLPTIPKPPRVDPGGSIWRTLLLTVLGTTVSIILTFGTSQLLQQHRNMQANSTTSPPIWLGATPWPLF